MLEMATILHKAKNFKIIHVLGKLPDNFGYFTVGSDTERRIAFS